MTKKRAYKMRDIVRDASGRIIHAKISFRGTLRDLRARLGAGQEAADKEMQRWVMAYVPYKTGTLMRSVPENTRVGTGDIVVGTPYGHRQNFMEAPYKTPRIRERYASMPDRGPHFIERAIEDHGEDVIAAAQKAIDAGGDIT